MPHAGRRVHHPGLGDRPDPRASPDPRRARGARRAAEPPIDAGPHEPGRVTRAARPDRPLSTAPSPRHHAGTFGVGGSPTGASDRSPPASPPTGSAVLTAHEARERGGGHAAARLSVLARSAITPYTRPTPIEFPIQGEYAFGLTINGERDRAGEICAIESQVGLRIPCALRDREMAHRKRDFIPGIGGGAIVSVNDVVRSARL